MAIKAKKDCIHSFIATGGKGTLEVECFSLNKRGKPSKAFVNTTVFKCAKCGVRQEYPDTWEKNFRLPGTCTPIAVNRTVASVAKKPKLSTA